MVEPTTQEVRNVGENLPRPDRREMAAEVAAREAVDHVHNQADEQKPHGGEMPEQRASKPDIVVDALGPLPAPQPNGQPGWKLEAKQRLLIVDLPAAPDQDDHAQGPAP